VNTNKLKVYAQSARREFIDVVTERAHFYGISANGVDPCEVKGDFAIINGSAFPRRVDEQRSALEEHVNRKGFSQVMEEVAYTWFNRFAAIRYMELHGFLSHGYRVLSHPDGSSIPEILEKAQHVELTGLNKEEVIKLKMDGTQDEKLYSKLLIAECNELSKAMPFLFEYVQDYTELLFPDNLLHSDSIIRKLVSGIDEEDWQEIEIIGWLYQFYISEKKDEVIGKVVKSEDIPAATQLFTPNWIVKYMVQNSLGAQWLATYPNSPLKWQMEYYIEPAEQTDEVQAQLAAITASTLNPEELILIDPACGSGHILVEAYDLFKAIYLERGYRQRDVAQLILEKNLFGLDIDERAAQLTGFVLMMKGRSDDRRLFEREVKLNVMSLVDSAMFDEEGLSKGVELGNYGLQLSDLTELKQLFEYATTFGSLIKVPEGLAKKLPGLKQLSEATSQDLFVSEALKRLGPLVQQTELLAAQYDAVVANPPYMGGRSFCPVLKGWVKENYQNYDKDLFSAFIVRIIALTKCHGHSGVMTSFVWMFISSYEQLRRKIVDEHTINSLVQLHYDAFVDAKAHVCTFVMQKNHIGAHRSSFIRLADFPGVDNQGPKTLEAIRNRECGWFHEAIQSDFNKVPGSPVAYWLSEKALWCYEQGAEVSDRLKTAIGLNTGDNDRFLRRWYEVGARICLKCESIEAAASSESKWFPYAKGGAFRKWYGNREHIINWENNGQEIKDYAVIRNNGKHWSRYIQNLNWMFKPGITWSFISSATFGVRVQDGGSLFDVAGSCAFPRTSDDNIEKYLGLLCSPLAFDFLKAQNPTLNFQARNVGNIPWIEPNQLEVVAKYVRKLIRIARTDWDAYERSWDFLSLPLLTTSSGSAPSLESSYTICINQNRETIAEVMRLEEENNRLFIEAYGLADELAPDVPIKQISLTVNPPYRYGGKLTEEEQWTRFRQDTMEELISYAIGCMMGRYSLDKKGLVYAHAGNEGFDHNNYKIFPADDDGIIPITEAEWFDDDAACRFLKFIETAWEEDTLDDNLEFVTDAIGRKSNESSRDFIRRYFVNGFFKKHLQTYRKRPIYWLFTSGKEKAFQALVYLHRYNEGTLSRMRTEYVLPLQGKITTRMEHLEKDKDHASSTSAANKIQKEIGKLGKQKEELLKFDENLHHYADKKISLDLDDGVKVNYDKFGDLLAEVKAVTGKKQK
jgi:type II restriction/modification system DNA methylase subunit YeeA